MKIFHLRNLTTASIKNCFVKKEKILNELSVEGTTGGISQYIHLVLIYCVILQPLGRISDFYKFSDYKNSD